MLRDVDDQTLRKWHESDYYWYLRSPEFAVACLEPIAAAVNSVGGRCLDCCCASGYLSPLIECEYVGFDASKLEIAEARDRYPSRDFHVARVESFQHEGLFDTIVFGGVVHCLIEPDSHEALIDKYLEFCPKQFIVYDLELLNPRTAFDMRFELIEERHVTIDLPIQEAKRHRKVLVYQC